MAVTLTSLGVAALLAVAIFLKASRMEGDWRRGSVLIPTFLVAGLGLFSHLVLTTPLYGLAEEWNGCRLAPVASLARGYSLYYPADQGPILNLIYGPVAALIYAPTLAFGSAQSMVVAGVTIAVLLVAIPLFVCHWRVRGTGSDVFLRTLLAFLVCFLALSIQYGTSDWYRNVHADAPALGFGLLACASLIPAPSRRSLVLAALFTALALWSKQTSIGLACGIAAWLWIAHDRGHAIRYGLWLTGFGAAFGLIAIAAFGFGPLAFNMFTIPSRHPWQPNALRTLLGDALRYTVVPVAILILAFAALDRSRLRPEFAARAWTLFLLVAVFMIPTSLLGRVKIGGEPNSLHCVLYLYVAASLSLLQASSEVPSGWPRLAVVSAAVLFGSGYAQAAQLLPAQSLIDANVYRQADLYRQEHPGEVYFPTNPLCTLLAESKLYHFDYGVYDRTLAGFAPTPDHLRAHLPQRLKFMAYYNFPPRVMKDLTRDARWMPEPNDRSMYGWTLYVASP
jgi:uncharacterized membrane protein